jgi:radical SAM protein with 4Fe4S-binding SPASM domain
MTTHNVPINKGNYSLDTTEREALFDQYRGEGWEKEYQEYRHHWSSYPLEQKISDYPLLVDIELSSVCNLKCPMCYTITDEFRKKVHVTKMDWELYKKIIDEIEGKVPAIRLSLRGEATLHTKFIEAIQYAKEHGIKEVSMLTNGSKLTLPYFIQMAEAGIDWITISVDGTGEIYESVRKPLKFSDLLEKIKKIYKYKQEHNLKRPVIKVQGIWPSIVESGIDTYYNTFAQFVDLVAFNPLIDYLFNDTDIEYLDEFTCPQQYQRMVIGADGLVMKCSNDEENQDVMGNIHDETVRDVWHGDKMQAVRDTQLLHQGFMQSKVCRKCYLPRKTEDQPAQVGDRSFIVRNYVNRTQVIGK